MTAPNKHLIVIAGPTASGKTGLGVAMAQHYNTVVLSADSRQFFREMSIGTAKPTQEEMQGVEHYFIDSLSVSDTYSAGQYEHDALEVLEQQFAKHDVVLMVGGSGLYVNAVCHGMDAFAEVPQEIRAALNEAFETEGLEPLLNELEASDPDYFATVDRENPRRVIRALEVIRSSGKPFSSFRQQEKKQRPFQYHKLGINIDREVLYGRINQRVELMMQAGQEAEARALFSQRELTALQTVGYSELFEYFNGYGTLEEAVELIKRNTRRYAKRQMTWLRRDEEVQWVDAPYLDNALAALAEIGAETS